jgi:hypothetical protein
METEYIQDCVGDEDDFSTGKHYIPNQYFKCTKTGMEMDFTFHIPYGWCVSFPNSSLRESLNYEGKIPFPDKIEKYARQEKEFYEMLEKIKEEDGDE